MGQPFLQQIVETIEAETGKQVPIAPDTLAVALGISLTPQLGARFMLRRQLLTYDPALPRDEQDTLIARGCATYVLCRAGLIKDAAESIPELASALCGVPDMPLSAAKGFSAA
jgi:hypothetical protein